MDKLPGLSRETVCLRLSSFALIGAPLILFLYFEKALDPRSLIALPKLSDAIWPLIYIVLLANVMVIGFIFLLAGLRELSLLRNRQARGAALVRLVGANFLFPSFLFIALVDDGDLNGLLEASPMLDVIALPAILLLLYLVRASLLLLRSSWKYEAVSAEKVLLSDPRPPVVYLRAFGIDDEVVSRDEGRFARLSQRLNFTATVSPEQELAWILGRVGPVVAIGKPGETLPQLGAVRLYVDDDHWRGTIDKLIARSALVIIRAGNTSHLWWEVEQAMTRQRPDRVIIIVLGPKEQWVDFDRRLVETFGTPRVITGKAPSPFSQILGWIFPKRGQGKVIFFDQSRVPHQISLSQQYSWHALLITVYSQHGAALREGMKPVFDALGIPWKTSERSLTNAVLLALFGGMCGLQYFYLGNRRRGIWCCLLFWSGIPMALGVVDAVRLSLLSENQFRARFPAGER